MIRVGSSSRPGRCWRLTKHCRPSGHTSVGQLPHVVDVEVVVDPRQQPVVRRVVRAGRAQQVDVEVGPLVPAAGRGRPADPDHEHVGVLLALRAQPGQPVVVAGQVGHRVGHGGSIALRTTCVGNGKCGYGHRWSPISEVFHDRHPSPEEHRAIARHVDRNLRPARSRRRSCRCWCRSTTKEDPTLFGFPFYFWFQLALIPFAVVLTVIAYYLAKGADRRDRAGPQRGGGPMSDVSTVAFSVFLFLFLLVTVLGFAAARWRRAKALDNLDEWGLGGRGFGTFIAWFLIGGDLYTAYTFVAVPALLYAGSAIGFFAVPYTIVVYPLIFLFLPRLWSVSHRHGYVTPADFVAGPLRQPPPRPGRRAHRHPRDDALHRAAARRHRGRAAGDGHRRRRGPAGSPGTPRCSSRSGCSPPTPTPPACARRR